MVEAKNTIVPRTTVTDLVVKIDVLRFTLPMSSV